MCRYPKMRSPEPSAEGVDEVNPPRGAEGDPLEDLRLLLAEPGKPLNARSVLLILSRILSLSRQEARLQRCEGYMSEVLEKWPRWNRQVATMRSQTMNFRLSVDRRMACILRTMPRSGVVERLPSFVKQWTEALSGIRLQESRFLQEAFTSDLGGEA